MAIAFDTFSTASAGLIGTTLSWTHTPVGTPTLALLNITFLNASATVAGATYGGLAMTAVSGPVRNGLVTAYIYKLESPPAGAQTVNFVLDGFGFSRKGGLTTYTGTAPSSALGTAATANGSSTAPSVAVTSASGELVHDCLAWASNTATVGAGQTERYNVPPDTIGIASSTEAGAVSVTMSWTLGASGSWAIIGVPIVGPTLESGALTVTGTTTVTIAGLDVVIESGVLPVTASTTVTIAAAKTEGLALAIGATTAVTIAATEFVPPVVLPVPSLAVFGSGSPATVYVALLSYPWSTGTAATEVTGTGYQRVAVANDASHWVRLGQYVRNLQTVTYQQAGSDWTTATGWAIYDDATAVTVDHLLAFGMLGGHRPVPTDSTARFASYAIGVVAGPGTATLNVYDLAPDLWSGFEGAQLDTEWGVCSVCGHTVPVRELLYNRRYGWQCIRGEFGIGCWDGWIQRDEYLYLPAPGEGARKSSTPTGLVNTDRVPPDSVDPED